MISKFEYNPKNLYTPVIFRQDFNAATITATQAWSLFFTAGQEENLFGTEKETGWFYNNFLVAVVISLGIGAAFFSSPLAMFF
jgi:hypothetical protein